MIEIVPTAMVPLDRPGTVEALLQVALYNIDQFNHAFFETWRKGRGGGIPELARRRPPDRVYRVITDNEREGSGAPLLLGVVVGYGEATRGMPAVCVVHVLGVREGFGSYGMPLVVPEESLEDVTEKARAGKIHLGG